MAEEFDPRTTAPSENGPKMGPLEEDLRLANHELIREVAELKESHEALARRSNELAVTAQRLITKVERARRVFEVGVYELALSCNTGPAGYALAERIVNDGIAKIEEPVSA